MMPRLFTIMGSGETAPTMVKVHRSLIERVGGGPAVLLDTPYGFQENASDISERAQEYFATSVGTPITVATFRSRDVDGVVAATASTRIAEARYVFAGPGSPTYALAQWAGTPIPGLVIEKLRDGGGVTFASAAALTTGILTVPVYEIYKAGAAPHWLEGLNLFEAATGLRAAVIPHYDNAEGGHHDTRFCYLGERRLAMMETMLPDDAFVLGVDEHTGAVFDVDAGTMTVVGRATVTVRRHGVSRVLEAGSVVPIASLAEEGIGSSSASASSSSSSSTAPASAPSESPSAARSPLLEDAARLESAFTAALAARDVPGAVAAVLELDQTLHDWSRDTLQSDEPDRVRVQLRSMIVRLGELAQTGARDPREIVGPLVELLVTERQNARATKDFAASDRIRDGLTSAGVELRDTPAGPEWHLAV
jgi:cyanophycinase-like exopeptidase